MFFRKKVYNKKPKWHSESKLSELLKESPRYFQRQTLAPASSLPSIPDRDEPYFYQQPGTEKKVNDFQVFVHFQTKIQIDFRYTNNCSTTIRTKSTK